MSIIWARELARVCSPLRGTDTDGLLSPRATNFVIVICRWFQVTNGVTTCRKIQEQNLDTPTTFRQEPGYPVLGQTLISSQNESETYQTKCLKVTCLENDRESAATCIKVTSLDSQTGLKEESGTYHKPTGQKKK